MLSEMERKPGWTEPKDSASGRIAGREIIARGRVAEALSAEARRSLSLIFGLTVAIAATVALSDRIGWPMVAIVAISLATIFGLVIRALPAHPHVRFGPANTVTAVRAALVSFIAGLILCFDGLAEETAALWLLSAIVLVVLALDGLDGLLARRSGLGSSLGTRFDMEVDALLILVLSATAFTLGKAGVWVLLIGMMRYGFVAAVFVDPRMGRDLPPSFRRKLVCVVQVVALMVIMVPVVTPPVSTALAAMALLALVYSFAVDIFSLLRLPKVVA